MTEDRATAADAAFTPEGFAYGLIHWMFAPWTMAEHAARAWIQAMEDER